MYIAINQQLEDKKLHRLLPSDYIAMSTTPRPTKDTKTKRPSIARRLSKQWTEDAGAKDLLEVTKGNEKFQVSGEFFIEFDDKSVEEEFKLYWRNKDIFQSFLVIAIITSIAQAVTNGPKSLTTVENIVVTTVPVFACMVSLIITVVNLPLFFRYYDFIVSGTIVTIAVTTSVHYYIARVSTEAFDFGDGCYFPNCGTLYPATSVMGLLFFLSTSLRLRFITCVISSLIIATVEEVLLNVGGDVEIFPLVNSLIAVVMVIWGGLGSAYKEEMLARKTYVLTLSDFKSLVALDEKINKTRQRCCPNFNAPREDRGCCLQFKEEKDRGHYLDKMRIANLEEGVDLPSAIFGTASAIVLYLMDYPSNADPGFLGKLGLPEKTEFDWRGFYAATFVPLYILIGLLFIAVLVLTYVKKTSIEKCRLGNKTNRGFGVLFYSMFPVVFACLWLHQITATPSKALFLAFEAAPLEKTPCLPQNEWVNIVENAEYGIGPLNDIVCGMTKSYNSSFGRNATCDPFEFDSITGVCASFALPAYTIFALQTVALWHTPYLPYGMMSIFFILVYYVIVSVIYYGSAYLAGVTLKIAPFIVATSLCIYERTLSSQLTHIASGRTKRRGSVNLRQDPRNLQLALENREKSSNSQVVPTVEQREEPFEDIVSPGKRTTDAT